MLRVLALVLAAASLSGCGTAVGSGEEPDYSSDPREVRASAAYACMPVDVQRRYDQMLDRHRLVLRRVRDPRPGETREQWLEVVERDPAVVALRAQLDAYLDVYAPREGSECDRR